MGIRSAVWILFSTLFCVSCQPSQGKSYKRGPLPGQASANGNKRVGTEITIPLPNLADFQGVADPSTVINGFAITAEPQGECPTPGFTDVGPYAAQAKTNLDPKCDFKVTLGLGSIGEEGGGAALVVSYVDDIKPYVDASCAANCHNGVGTGTDLLTTYEEVSLIGGGANGQIQSDAMPQGGPPASADIKAKFQAWVDSGFPETKPAALQAVVTYESDIKPYFDRACTAACHNGIGTGVRVLTTFEQARDGAQASNTEMIAGRMPVGAPPSNADKALFQAWIDGGLLQNAGDTGGDGGEGGGDAPPVVNQVLTATHYKSQPFNLTKDQLATPKKLNFSVQLQDEGKDAGFTTPSVSVKTE